MFHSINLGEGESAACDWQGRAPREDAKEENEEVQVSGRSKRSSRHGGQRRIKRNDGVVEEIKVLAKGG
jgi:hypothetical protein